MFFVIPEMPSKTFVLSTFHYIKMDSQYLVVGMDHVEDNDGAAQRDVEVSVGQQTSNNK